MKIILLETLNKIGKAGEIVSVKDGYANNYLIPEKKAIISNKKNKEELQSKLTLINENNERKTNKANELKTKLDKKNIIIEMESNEDGNLYGNIGLRQISEKIKAEYLVDIEPGDIILDKIKTLGEHSITIRLYDEITATLKLEIVKKI